MTDKKRQIYEAAKALFIEHGYDDVSIQMICDHAGITKSTFYYHVASKHDILIYYYDLALSDTQSTLVQIIGETDPYKKVCMLFQGLLDSIQAYGVSFNTQALIISLKERLTTFYLRDEFKAVGTSLIAHGQSTGHFQNPSDPSLLLETAAYLFTSYELMWCMRDGDFDWAGHFFTALRSLLLVADID